MDDSSSPFLVTARGTGAMSRAQARGRRLMLTSRGVRLPIAAGDADALRLIQAAQLPLRADVVLSHTTAARLLGLPLPRHLQDDNAIHVTAGRHHSRPRRRDIVTHHAQMPEMDVAELGDFRLTTPARTFVDLAAVLDFAHLVAVGDVALRRHSTSREAMLVVARRRLRYPGRKQAVAAIAWLDPRAESPRESHLRVLLRRAGLPSPEVNGVITDEAGQFLARGDLVFRRHRVIVEYEGEVHAPLAQRAKDAARRALLREHGWIVVEIVGEDMRYPARVLARVQAALQGSSRHR
jgi:very-short-patch-repair endonuclease